MTGLFSCLCEAQNNLNHPMESQTKIPIRPIDLLSVKFIIVRDVILSSNNFTILVSINPTIPVFMTSTCLIIERKKSRKFIVTKPYNDILTRH